MTAIDYRDGVSIGLLVVYFPALAIAILLSIRHGFGRSSGWLFLIIFSLTRLIGACFQLATINNPSIALHIGAAVLQAVGLSPLELTSLGLLSRIMSSINKSSTTFVQRHHLKFIGTVVIVGLILSIIGGINAGNDLASKGVYTRQPLSQAAMGLFIASFVLIVAVTIILSFSVRHAEHGEKRLLGAVALSLPFLLVRLVYGAISTFGTTTDFNSSYGNVTIYLCMVLIMELCVVIIYEGVGLSLRKIERASVRYATVDESYVQDPSKASQIASILGRRTFIGRLISPGAGTRNGDVEMQQHHGRRHARREARRWRRNGQ